MEDDEHSNACRPAFIFLVMLVVVLCDFTVISAPDYYVNTSIEYIEQAELSVEDDALTSRTARAVSLRGRALSQGIPAVSRFIVRCGVRPAPDVPPAVRPAHELFCVYRI